MYEKLFKHFDNAKKYIDEKKKWQKTTIMGKLYSLSEKSLEFILWVTLIVGLLFSIAGPLTAILFDAFYFSVISLFLGYFVLMAGYLFTKKSRFMESLSEDKKTLILKKIMKINNKDVRIKTIKLIDENLPSKFWDEAIGILNKIDEEKQKSDRRSKNDLIKSIQEELNREISTNKEEISIKDLADRI